VLNQSGLDHQFGSGSQPFFSEYLSLPNIFNHHTTLHAQVVKTAKGGTDADRPARELRTHLTEVGEKHERLRNRLVWAMTWA
jgi:hypothetical protein